MKKEFSVFNYLSKQISEIEKGNYDNQEIVMQPLYSVIKVLPDFLGLLIRLVMDNRLTKDQRLFAASAMVYLISPEDFIPERSLGIKGLVDDSILIARTLQYFTNTSNCFDISIEWRGKEKLLDVISSITENSSKLITSQVSEAIDLYIKMNIPKSIS